jgi:hypothetical protein
VQANSRPPVKEAPKKLPLTLGGKAEGLHDERGKYIRPAQASERAGPLEGQAYPPPSIFTVCRLPHTGQTKLSRW